VLIDADRIFQSPLRVHHAHQLFGSGLGLGFRVRVGVPPGGLPRASPQEDEPTNADSVDADVCRRMQTYADVCRRMQTDG
jgi:hypothetical protein